MTRAGARSSDSGGILPYALLALLAAALSIPAWLAPPILHDSFWSDVVWADQFTDQLRRGLLYPRWLPQSHGGLGSPVFYFYAPGAFWLTGLFGLAGASAYGSVLLAFGTALFASGVAMYHWLAGWTARPLAGACLYMAAPYHLCDFYGRGALAECCAFVFVPCVAIGLRRAAEGRGIAPLALAYAALTMTHLPMALLASVLLVVPYGLMLIRRDRRRAVPLALGITLGLMLSAIYVVPALMLQPYASIEKLWRVANLRPAQASFIRPDLWPAGTQMGFVIWVTVALAGAAACFAWRRREYWAFYALGCCAVVAGLVPGFWSLPLISQVQFPWRALLLVEFGVATAFARSPMRSPAATIALFPALLLSTVFLRQGGEQYEWTLPKLLRSHPEVLEYLPPGATDERDVPPLRPLALARNPPPRFADGRTIEPIYFFPAWQVRCGGAEVSAFPDPATKLLSYRGRGCLVRLGRTPAEQAGGAISLGALLLLAIAVIRRGRRRAGAAARGGESPRR